jgi:isoamylase
MQVWPGHWYPLGATWDGTGTNFSVFSQHALRVELCLFDEAGRETRIPLPEVTAGCWHGFLPDVGPGQRYGFRVDGPFAPEEGHRFNAAKLLLDPYAKAIDGEMRWNPAVYGYRFDDPAADLSRNDDDSAPFVPRSVVVDTRFEWGDDSPPRVSWHNTLIYETHVKGLTARHPAVPPEQRGTFAALSSPAVVDHLLRLGVTAVELLPIHHFLSEPAVVERGLSNYWGYNSIGFFAPHAGYGSTHHGGERVREFKAMVRALHAAGLEVILDVVYNHTAEGNHLGPTLSLKGLDNAGYYRLVEDERRYYVDYTGCGNSLNMRHPHVLQLLMDSLRYWVVEMHVDGFRFDLAAALAREFYDVDRLSAFFDLIQQDPVVCQVKLIAEPWDVGAGGYQVGNFPPLWSEWNGKYRDTVRDYWRGEDNRLPEFANRLTGSADLYKDDGRRPYASINFVTAHDGFTLRDLVSYNEKHNEANGEQNADGDSHNRSWNCGAEGDTDDAGVLALRARQQRNFLATLLLSQGVPMLLGGDELDRTQRGNNNAYCQDNELTWYDWDLDERAQALLAFTRRVTGLRRRQPALRRRRWFYGRPLRGVGASDIHWFDPAGQEMTEEQWQAGFAKSFAVFLNGDAIPSRGPHGERVVGDSLLLLFNAHYERLDFAMPDPRFGKRWELLLDTDAPEAEEMSRAFSSGEQVPVEGRAIAVFRRAD